VLGRDADDACAEPPVHPGAERAARPVRAHGDLGSGLDPELGRVLVGELDLGEGALELKLLHGSSDQVCRLLASGEADVGLTTQPAAVFPDLLMLEYCQLPRALIVPRQHPLAKRKGISLERISTYPLITLDAGSHGQANMRKLFASKGLEPNIVFSGANVDIVKAFVEAGLGIAILPRLSFDPAAAHLFDRATGNRI